MRRRAWHVVAEATVTTEHPQGMIGHSGYPLPSERNGHIVRPALLQSSARNGRPEYLKEMNTLVVLEMFRNQGPISRADVARLTGISAPTVSKVVEKLIDVGLVLDEGAGASTGGKRPTLLRFNARFGRVLGIDLGGTHLRVVLANLDGTVLDRADEAIDATTDAEAILAQVVRSGRRLLAAHGLQRPIAVGLATPGIVDVVRGVVVGARNLKGWSDVPVRDALAGAFGAPVTVDNDVNLAAVGERWHGAGRGHDDVAFVAVGTGIGAGVIVGGQVHRGAHFAAGEINSIPSGIDDGDGELWIEDVAGGPAIVRRALARGICVPRDQLTTDAVFDMAEHGDAAAADVVADAIDAIGRGVAALLAGIDPSVVVIGGGVSRQGDRLLVPLRERLSRMVRLRARLQLSELGVDAQVHGALFAALGLADESLVALGRSAGA